MRKERGEKAKAEAETVERARVWTQKGISGQQPMRPNNIAFIICHRRQTPRDSDIPEIRRDYRENWGNNPLSRQHQPTVTANQRQQTRRHQRHQMPSSVDNTDPRPLLPQYHKPAVTTAAERCKTPTQINPDDTT